jgi:AraC family transcriptional regulator of adaptative response / DNA-3-methyladenine glycosylase II
VPRAADPGELAIRAVLGQQVSLAGAATLAGRLVAAYGAPLATPVGAVTHAFPTADALAANAARGLDPAGGDARRSDAPDALAADAARALDSAGGDARRPDAPGPDARAWAMPASRRRAIGALAQALACGDVVLDPAADPRETEERLLALPGIGPWTASYIAMRALRDNDAFLPSDLGVRHALDRLGLDSRPAAAEAASQSWRPFRAYALQHLWAVTA